MHEVLQGIRVVEVAQFVFVPVASAVLATGEVELDLDPDAAVALALPPRSPERTRLLLLAARPLWLRADAPGIGAPDPAPPAEGPR